MRGNEGVAHGIIAVTNSSVAHADVVVVGGLEPASAEEVGAERDAHGLALLPVGVKAVAIRHHDDLLHDVQIVELCEVCHLESDASAGVKGVDVVVARGGGGRASCG